MYLLICYESHTTSSLCWKHKNQPALLHNIFHTSWFLCCYMLQNLDLLLNIAILQPNTTHMIAKYTLYTPLMLAKSMSSAASRTPSRAVLNRLNVGVSISSSRHTLSSINRRWGLLSFLNGREAATYSTHNKHTFQHQHLAKFISLANTKRVKSHWRVLELHNAKRIRGSFHK